MAVKVCCPNPNCDATYSVAADLIGRASRCKKCGTQFVLSHEGDLSREVLEIPNPLGRYRIEKPLGHGGMGAVYLAFDSELDRRVALKVPKFDDDGLPDHVARFRREANILARVTHPNIAHLIDAGVSSDGQPYLVLELVEGAPIDRYCDERNLDVRARRGRDGPLGRAAAR